MGKPENALTNVSSKGKNGSGEHLLLHCLDLELPVQIDNSIEQDFLFHEKEIIYPAVANVIYEHEKSQQNSEEIEWSKTLVGMPTFTIKEIEKHR